MFQDQGIPADVEVSARIESIYTEALEMFLPIGRPTGLWTPLSPTEFDGIFSGAGLNDPDAPLAKIYPRAANLAIFALTLGEEVSARIEQLFSSQEFALASMLDSIASLAADLAVARLSQDFARQLLDEGLTQPNHHVIEYSPGYCGWHVSGQSKLFACLKPEKIGITLNSSYLMSPLKSVSGVLVDGPAEIHRFKPTFSFCRACQTFSCVPRMRALDKEITA